MNETQTFTRSQMMDMENSHGDLTCELPQHRNRNASLSRLNKAMRGDSNAWNAWLSDNPSDQYWALENRDNWHTPDVAVHSWIEPWKTRRLGGTVVDVYRVSIRTQPGSSLDKGEVIFTFKCREGVRKNAGPAFYETSA